MTQLLRDVSPHRLYDESQKLFTMGHLARVLPMLIDFGVWKQLLLIFVRISLHLFNVQQKY